MRFTREPGKIHLVLDVGDEVIPSLVDLAKQEDIPSASFTGIGALRDVTLGYFDVDKLDYLRREFPGSWELVSLTGSIAHSDGEPIVHAHACIGGPEFEVHAGHLFEGTVSVTGEIFLLINETKLQRAKDGDFGLKLLDI